jgi:pimeloyl-ACP methyl ester carboxylesterase
MTCSGASAASTHWRSGADPAKLDTFDEALLLGQLWRWRMSSWPVALISIVRSSCVGFAAIIVGCCCACAPQSSPARHHAFSPAGARAVLAAEAEVPSTRSERGARFAAAPCWFRVASQRDIDCGELTVPENWSRPESKRIHLPVVIFRAAGASCEPIVFLNGGPGDPSRIHTADEIRSWLELLHSQKWTHRRDFIVMAQRGTNWTDSNLSCPALKELWRRGRLRQSDQSWRSRVKGATVACARQLALSHDLSAYNTTQSVRDVAALRQALDVEAWSVYAVSYGTRFALSLMRDYPAGLRSVVLDSVYPPGITDPLGFAPAAFLENLSAVFAACALDLACRRIYGELDTSFESAIQRLRSAPISVPDTAGGDGHVFGPSGLVEVLFDLMYSSDTVGFIPEFVHGLAQYPEPYLHEWLADWFEGDTTEKDGAEPIVEGAFLAIRCNDAQELSDSGWWARAASAQPLLREWILEREQAVPCPHWPAVTVPVEETERVASAIPTILLVGAFDPATPSAYAEFAVATLTKADLFRFGASGHGILGSDPCAAAIVEAFLEQPDARPTAACMSAARSVDFSPSFQMHALHMLAQGELAEAVELLRQTLTHQEERLPPDDPGIAVTLSVLGEVHYEQRRLGDAEGLLKRALAINSKAYGSDSVEAGKSAGRLALVYDDQSKNEEAASLYRRTLRILEREYGRKHIEVSFYRDRYSELVATSADASP